MKQLIAMADIYKLRDERIVKGVFDRLYSMDIGLHHTPPVTSGDFIFTLFMCNSCIEEEVVKSMDNIDILGECIDGEYVFYTPEKQERYESILKVGKYFVPVELSDGMGGTYLTTESYKVGTFYG